MSKNNGFNPISNLPILPQMKFENDDYARLECRLDLYNDMIVMTHFVDKGQAERSFVIDPLAVAQALGGLDIDSGLLPAGALFWQRKAGQERLAVWLPPQVWRVKVEPTTQVNRVIPLPGLVMVGCGKEYQLYALDIDDRPGPEAKLYNAPCPNVSGTVCQGNVDFPAAGAATMGQAVWLFFESGFNNHLSGGKSQQYPQDVLGMWRELHQAQAEIYPVDDLVPQRGTLGDLA